MSNENRQTMEALLHDIREDVRSLAQAIADLIRAIDQRYIDGKKRSDMAVEDIMRIVMVIVEEYTTIKNEREEENKKQPAK